MSRHVLEVTLHTEPRKSTCGIYTPTCTYILSMHMHTCANPTDQAVCVAMCHDILLRTAHTHNLMNNTI